MSKSIIGVSAFYHDSAACIIKDGKLIAAVQEERFTRKRHDQAFPLHSIAYCLEVAGLKLDEVDALVFYEKPFVKFERLLETYFRFAPAGLTSFLAAAPVWLKKKLFIRTAIQKECETHFGAVPKKILFSEHHLSHAASAFYPSPFREAAVMCLDGVGEWSTSTGWVGRDDTLKRAWEIRFPHSIGLLYSAFTYYTGFKVNSGEYKVMGLAPYGKPVYVQKILDNLIDLKEDGSFRLNMDYFNFCTGLTMTNSKFDAVFGGPPRKMESTLTQREMDLARSVQEVTEEVVLRLAKSLHAETGMESLTMAGGVALNCVANGRLLREGPFKNVWIQPAAGDAGGAVGAAWVAWHNHLKLPRNVQAGDTMSGGYLGPAYGDTEVRKFLDEKGIKYSTLSESELYERVADELAVGKVVGWFQGRMEFGPRSLGARSILGDARSPKMQATINLKIKFRESFRPFAPSVLREKVADYFELESDSPYMLLVAPVREDRRIKLKQKEQDLWGIDLLNVPKSDIPAVTHVDYSARVQTVHEETNPRYHHLLKAFEKKTGCAVIVNTSFNVRGEPIVCTPEDAVRCFMRTEIDTLALGNIVINKSDMGEIKNDVAWMKEYELD